MKKFLLPFVALFMFSCSTNDIVEDSGQIENSTDENKSSSRIASSQYYVNPLASCNPFETATEEYFFNQPISHSAWNLPTGNFILDGHRSGPNYEPVYVTGGTSDYLYANLNSVASYVSIAPGMTFNEQSYFVVSYSETATADPFGNFNWTHLGDTVSSNSITFLRDELACQIIEEYERLYKDDYLLGGIRFIHIDHNIGGATYPTRDRILKCYATLGEYVVDDIFPF